MQDKHFFIAFFSLILLGALVVWGTMTTPEYLQGQVFNPSTYYITYCKGSGDGPKHEFPHVAGAVLEIKFNASNLAGLPPDLNTLTIGLWTYNPPANSSRRGLWVPLHGTVDGGSGTVTYTGPGNTRYTGTYRIVKDFAGPLQFSSRWSHEHSYLTWDVVNWELREAFVEVPSTRARRGYNGLTDTCIEYRNHDSPTAGIGSWTIVFPGANSGYPNIIQGNASKIP